MKWKMETTESRTQKSRNSEVDRLKEAVADNMGFLRVGSDSGEGDPGTTAITALGKDARMRRMCSATHAANGVTLPGHVH